MQCTLSTLLLLLQMLLLFVLLWLLTIPGLMLLSVCLSLLQVLCRHPTPRV